MVVVLKELDRSGNLLVQTAHKQLSRKEEKNIKELEKEEDQKNGKILHSDDCDTLCLCE